MYFALPCTLLFAINLWNVLLLMLSTGSHEVWRLVTLCVVPEGAFNWKKVKCISI